ncbi:suppressor APC domain-containing protein 2-like [Physella acuta]|uniref:suppressor APC domain-containing protein 2-like n=1 Tax=Physella acuta TaxID=109671 RepID=UPI0027DB638D|nr:suppressor APC domain-containing protein 2-like [Physella acuta]
MNYISNINSQKDPADARDGLPKQFLSSLRILFDILDENQTGFVRLRDIESRWSDDGVRGLPPGVVDGLRKVTPSSGLLSFDRFVAGLKLVLTKKKEANATDARKPFSSKENRLPHAENHDYGRRDRSLPRTTSDTSNNRTGNEGRYGARALQSNNYRDQDNYPHQRQYHQQVPTKTSDSSDSNYYHGNRQTESNKASGQTNVHEATMHTSQPVKKIDTKIIKANGGYSSHQSANSRHPLPNSHYEKPPQIPPRNEQPSRVRETTQLKKSLSGPDLHSQPQQPPAVPPRDKQASTRILSELKNWQKEWASNQPYDKMYNRDREKLNQPRLNSDQDNTIYANIEDFQNRQYEKPPQSSKVTVRRHGSGRRHTLANGIDQNMLKRMKQLEEEMAILRTGLSMVDTAREWYIKQMQSVTDKQAMIDKVNYNDYSVEAHQERMNFQRARIAEVNHHLHTLVESSEKGFPLHMNLALPVAAPVTKNDDLAVRSIKEQNRRLLEEVNQKKDQISLLEKEKSSLVRELFEARAKNKTDFDDTTFM